MNAALEQLRRLRGQAGSPVAAPLASRHATAPTSTAELRGLLRLRRVRTSTTPVDSAQRILPGEEIAPGLRLCRGQLAVPSVPATLDGRFDRRASIASSRVLFFDTETTGLAGGTGTRAFMIGAAAWLEGRLHWRQLFITRLAAEAAMLAEFARWLGPDTVLSSYNGKSYDVPLLRTRYRLARQPDPTVGLDHIDLLHPTRRRYRGHFENCRLATIEKRVLGVEREDDLPGSEAPAAWLDYLRGGPSSNLCRVLEHNRQDIISLARLLRHLAG